MDNQSIVYQSGNLEFVEVRGDRGPVGEMKLEPLQEQDEVN